MDEPGEDQVFIEDKENEKSSDFIYQGAASRAQQNEAYALLEGGAGGGFAAGSFERRGGRAWKIKKKTRMCLSIMRCRRLYRRRRKKDC